MRQMVTTRRISHMYCLLLITSVYYHHSTPLCPLIELCFHLQTGLGSGVFNSMQIMLFIMPIGLLIGKILGKAQFSILSHLLLQDFLTSSRVTLLTLTLAFYNLFPSPQENTLYSCPIILIFPHSHCHLNLALQKSSSIFSLLENPNEAILLYSAY